MDERQREFVRLLTKCERSLYGYIFSLVPNWNDADEILQETNIRLWEEFDQFEPGTNFRSWAMTVAHFQVLTWCKRKKRSKLLFDVTLIEKLTKSHELHHGQYEDRHVALRECMDELSDRSRQLLARCYADGTKMKEIAESLNRTTESVYKAMQRLRATLHDCIQQRLAEEGAT
ncbi:MAG: sigma-70 family RNA polymerase sigma factor [Planctomycetota bacterium]